MVLAASVEEGEELVSSFVDLVLLAEEEDLLPEFESPET